VSIFIIKIIGTCSHIYQVPQPRDSEGSFRSSSQAATCYYQSNHLNLEAIPLSALPIRSQQAKLPSYLHSIALMLKVKQVAVKPTF